MPRNISRNDEVAVSPAAIWSPFEFISLYGMVSVSAVSRRVLIEMKTKALALPIRTTPRRTVRGWRIGNSLSIQAAAEAVATADV